jgi:hypothetical protein
MTRKLAITFAVVSVLTAVASSALAGQTVSEGGYSRSEIALSGSHLNTASAGPLSAFAFDKSGPQLVATTRGSEANGPYQGGPHPR